MGLPILDLQIHGVLESVLSRDGRLALSITSSGFTGLLRVLPAFPPPGDMPVSGWTTVVDPFSSDEHLSCFNPGFKVEVSAFSPVTEEAQRGKTLTGGHTAKNGRIGDFTQGRGPARLLPRGSSLPLDLRGQLLCVHGHKLREQESLQVYSPGLNPAPPCSILRGAQSTEQLLAWSSSSTQQRLV